MKNSQRSRKLNLGVFHVSCWVLGLVAFVQMMAVGVAMAFRNQRAPEAREGIVKEYVNHTFIGVKNIGGFHIPPSSNASSLYTQVTPL